MLFGFIPSWVTTDAIFILCQLQLEKRQTSRQIEKRHGVVVITTAQLHSRKPELRFCAGSNPARGMSEICDDEDL